MKALSKKSCSSINGLFKRWPDVQGCYRFLSNKRVTEEVLHDRLQAKCAVNVEGKRILVICDTSEFNLNAHKNRITNYEGLGMLSDNQSVGFLLHGILVVDKQNRCPLGWSYAHVFNRPIDNKPFTRANSSVPIEEKESYKWLAPSIASRDKVLSSSAHSLFIMDREGDIFEVLDKLPDSKTDVLIRAQHNRNCYNVEGRQMKLKDDICQREVKGIIEISINAEHGKRTKRITKAEVRYSSYRLIRPSKGKWEMDYSPYVEVDCVEVREKAECIPEGEDALIWHLLSSQPIHSMHQAVDLIESYKARWDIEEMFRLFKKEGFDLESSELEQGKSIRKLLYIIMESSIKIKQLKAARSGQNEVQIESIFDSEEIKCLTLLNDEYQGNTEKQKNPYKENTTPWASWIIARIGGWKGYASQRPPGTITFKRGLDIFNDTYAGYNLNKLNGP